MKLQKQFTLAWPVETVWSFFHKPPKVAACLPGAEYLGAGDGGDHLGRVSVKVGPFQVRFEGKAVVSYDDAARAIRLEGSGVDRKGGSRGKMTMDCALAQDGAATLVTIDAEVQLAGSIAQFGRTGLISEIAAVLIGDFVANTDAALNAERAAGAPTAAADKGALRGAPTPRRASPLARPISALAVLLALVKSWLAALLRRHTPAE